MNELMDGVSEILSNTCKLQTEMEAMDYPQSHCAVRHYLAGGLYAREITIPSGVTLVGAVHSSEHLCTVSQGRLLVTIDNNKTKEIAAPFTLVSQPGAKRAGHALETTVWTTYHYVGEETDIEKIEAMILADDPSLLMGRKNNVQKINYERRLEHEDFQKFCDEYGLTEEFVLRLSHFDHDKVPFPFEVNNIEQKESNIHGHGFFATAAIPEKTAICPMNWNGMRTPAGYMINHSRKSNCIPVLVHGNIWLVTLRSINSGEELTIDYRNAMNINGLNLEPIERLIK